MSSPRRRGLRAPSLLLTLISIGCTGSPKTEAVTTDEDPGSTDRHETTPANDRTGTDSDSRGSYNDSPDYGGSGYYGGSGG